MLCVVIIMSCFITISIQGNKDPLAWVKPCEPGRFYDGRECTKCFCNDKQKLNCEPPGVCKLSKGPPNSEFKRFLSHKELDSLPVVAHKGSECKPGLTYRIDCNRCLCLERRSLKCETRLCPSYDDVNRLRAAELTGKSCQDVKNEKCVKCSCTNKKYTCQAEKNCIPPLAKEKRPKKLGKRRCDPAKKYRLKDGTRRCTCSEDRKISCPGKRIKLDVDDAKKCTPGVVYKRDYNTCKCTEDNVLHCTQRLCVSTVSVEHYHVGITEATALVEVIDTDFFKPDSERRYTTCGVQWSGHQMDRSKRECNTCMCNENGTLYCTQDTCGDH